MLSSVIKTLAAMVPGAYCAAINFWTQGDFTTEYDETYRSGDTYIGERFLYFSLGAIGAIGAIAICMSCKKSYDCCNKSNDNEMTIVGEGSSYQEL